MQEQSTTECSTILSYGLGRGHAMALVHVIKNGPMISEKHVGSDGVHRNESTELRLDGKNNRPK